MEKIDPYFTEHMLLALHQNVKAEAIKQVKFLYLKIKTKIRINRNRKEFFLILKILYYISFQKNQNWVVTTWHRLFYENLKMIQKKDFPFSNVKIL